MAFSSDELHGANAMMPAFAKPGSTSLTATDTVNVDELKKAVDRIINDGVNVISAMGSYGECHTLLWEEFQTLTEATIQAVNKTSRARSAFRGSPAEARSIPASDRGTSARRAPPAGRPRRAPARRPCAVTRWPGGRRHRPDCRSR